MDNENKEIEYMRLAIELAKKGAGLTSPNPLVGAVIVKDGEIIGSGYHERYGELHAERNALMDCREKGNDPRGSDMYVTLEPCCHHGKQPPCTDAIIEAGIKRVIVGSDDPNPVVAGNGIGILRQAGIEVVTGFMKEECDSLNPVFFRYIEKKLPYVTMKYAMTLDGKIASVSGKSKWISSEKSRAFVHSLRSKSMGIMAGAGTVLADDPMLDVRDGSGLSPVRIICDSDLRTPLSSKVVVTAPRLEGDDDPDLGYRKYLPKTIIATTSRDEDKIRSYEEKGVRILTVPSDDEGRVDLPFLMNKLAEMGIDSVLLEGGGELNYSMLDNELVQKAFVFIGPKMLGGDGAKTPVRGAGKDSPEEAFRLVKGKLRAISGDVLIEGEIEYVHRDN